ncbi:MAG TPA: sulfotransferase family 2 domain-containing protein, partial [Anaerolineales bacterium]
KVAPEVTGLLPEALARPLTSPAYFRFAVVRNPYERIFSAWQSKILLREALQVEPYLKFDFFQMAIQNQADLARAFEGFLEHLAANEAPNFRDLHWTPQADLLQPDLISYTSLSRIEDTNALKLELARHLGPDAPDPFAGERKNRSLIPYAPEFITARAAELLKELYARDFQTFGYDLRPPEAKDKFSSSELEIALRSIAPIRGRNQRLSEIRGSLSKQIRNLDGQLAAQRQAVLEREGHIQQLNQLVAEHEKRIVELDQAMHLLASRIAQEEQVIQSLSTKVAHKEQAIQSLSSRAAEKEKELAEIKSSKAWKAALLLRGLRLRLAPPGGTLARMLHFLVRPLEKISLRRRLEQDRTLIVSSGLFDADWYLAKNPDVAEAKVEPARHYLLAGGFEGRDPGPNFSSSGYLDRYADVRDSGQNPLVHYLRYGRREGRAANAAQY